MARSSSSFVVAAALAGSLLFSTPALACKCMFPPVETAREDATAVFEGRVLTIEQAPGSDATNGERQVTLNIVRTWKGLEQDEHITVFTNGSSAACGYTFAKDSSYLIYARSSEDNKLHVSSCSRTKPLADAAEDLAFLGAGSTPVHVVPKGIESRDSSDASVGLLNGNLPPPTPASATPAAAAPKKKGCSIAEAGTQTTGSGADSWLLAVPALALWFRRRRT